MGVADQAGNGLAPEDFSACSLIISTAAAPSLMPEALPAVTVPPSFLNAGFCRWPGCQCGGCAYMFIGVESSRPCGWQFPRERSAPWKRPASMAAAARWLDDDRKLSSCIRRADLVKRSAAIFSAVMPICIFARDRAGCQHVVDALGIAIRTVPQRADMSK